MGVTVSVPIFNNRQTKSAVQKAKIQKQNSELDLLDNQKNLYKTIEGLWLDANSAQQRYVAAIEKLRSTQTSYDLIQEQFNLGMKNTVELLTEKNNLLNSATGNPASQIHGNTEHATAEILPGRTDYALTYSI